jgi:hypothetical protein
VGKNQLRPQYLEALPVFDHGDQNEWMEDVGAMARIRAREGEIEHTLTIWSHCSRTI